MRLSPIRVTFAVLFVVLVAALGVAGASARSSLAPENLIEPTLSGGTTVGSTLRATTGAWANLPTSFIYKWQRCSTDGTGCNKDLRISVKKTYTLAAGDVGHTVRVVVTAVNSDGRGDAAPSAATGVISSNGGPKNTAKPVISGEATAGQQLTVSAGNWTPAGVAITYQWQHCDTDDRSCRNVSGAKSSTYAIPSTDIGNKLRVLITAKNASGQTSLYSNDTEFVQSSAPAPTVNQAPTLRFLSLMRIGRRLYARFRVCDDGLGRITVVERDTKSGKLAYTRRYSVYTYASCGTFSRSWNPAPRFRTKGRMAVSLQAIDKSQRKSAMRSKSVYRSR